MQKELNPELFGTGAMGATRFHEAPAPSALQQSLKTEEKMAEMRHQVQFALDQLACVVKQVNEFIQGSQSRMERSNGAQKAVETHMQAFQAEVVQKFTHLHQRLSEQNSVEAKVQELIDRHNQVLRSYEVRLNQMQQLIVEKEQHMVQTRAALQDTKAELARLKRF